MTQPGVPAKHLVIGLGTGRCGTVSLSQLLDAQPGARVLHEGMLGGEHHLVPWSGGEETLRRWLDRLEQETGAAQLYGDVGMYFLPYVEQIAREHPTARFVCLKRAREATVKSFLAKTEGRNHWIDHDGSQWERDPLWDPVFPSYDVPTKEEALERYWDAYYQEAERLERRLPGRFRVFDMDVLNDVDGRRELLRHAGMEEGAVVSETYRANAYTLGERLRRAWVRFRDRRLS